MLRIVVISSLFVAACDVGSIPGAVPDGGGGGGGDGSGNGDDVCVNAVTPAQPKHAHADDATSKRGQTCMAAGCHLNGNTGAGAPAFTFAGTVSTAADGATPKPGATIKVVFGTTTVPAVADEDGNFYSEQAITLPAKTLATSCPTLAPMVGLIVTGQGNCNSCHTTGAGATTTPMYVQ
jgi:hypothetical protein